MKTIIIIEDSNVEQESIAECIRQRSGDFRLETCTDGEAAAVIEEHAEADLLIYDLSSLDNPQADSLARLTCRFPHIPCIAIVDEAAEQAEAVLTSGVSYCLYRPLNRDELYHQVRTQLRYASSGQLRGVAVYSMLQMLESEEKTCTLRIRSRERAGLIFLEKGVVIDAETDELEQEEAFYAIIGWEDAIVEVRYYNCSRPRTIKQPLISLIMEGFRLKDERENFQQQQEVRTKLQPVLKHISTVGNRLSLDIGARIKMEFEEMDSPLIGSMVGMIPDDYLIVTTPGPQTFVHTALESAGRIVVKFLHMGRLCMFKTQPVKVIDEPRLLFLHYPQVIHYHELRRAKRASIYIPCTFHLPKGPEFYGVLIDLSGLGCLCQIKSKGNAPLPPLDLDTRVQLRCLLPGLKEDQELFGNVKNIMKNADETHIGLEFSGLQNYLREIIEKYVYSVENPTC